MSQKVYLDFVCCQLSLIVYVCTYDYLFRLYQKKETLFVKDFLGDNKTNGKSIELYTQ